MSVPDLVRGGAYKPMVRAAVASREASHDAGLDSALLELVNVRVSQINGCAACLSAHVPAARKAGVPEKTLDVLPAWRELDGFTPRQRAALGLAEALTRLDSVAGKEAAQEQALAEFTAEQVSALEWTIVLINAFNRVSIASRHQVRLGG